MSALVRSVNVGLPQEAAWAEIGRTSIDKRPVAGPVRVHRLGLGGDQVSDTRHHGGVDQAVYAYAREDLDDWAVELGRPLSAGSFGENLTTRGLDVQDARLGDRWRVGTALVEVCDVRIPCSVFQGFLDEQRWVKRFTEKGVPGAYLRVIEPGTVQAGDAITVVDRREHDLTVGLAFRALTTQRELLARLAEEPRASAKIHARAAELAQR